MSKSISDSVKTRWTPWLLIGLLHLFVAVAGIFLGTGLTADSVEYLQAAVNIRDSLSFYCGDLQGAIRPEWYSLRPPLYSLFLLLTGSGDSIAFMTLLVQAFLGTASVFLAWRCAVILSGRKISEWWALVPLSAFLPQFIYSGMIMSEMIFQFTWLLIFYCGVFYHHSGDIKWVIRFQFLLTLAMLIKPVAWIFPLLAFPFAIWMVFRKGYSKKILLSFLMPFIVIVGMHVRNYSLTGVSEYSSVSRKLLINYNVAELLSIEYGVNEAYRKIDSLQTTVSTLNYPERASQIDAFNKGVILDAPFTYAWLHMKGIFKFFLDSGRWEYRRYFALDAKGWKNYEDSGNAEKYLQQWSFTALLYQMYCLLMNVFLVMVLIRFSFSSHIDYRDRRLLAGMILYLALLTGPSASARFRLPVFPLQLITFVVVVSTYQHQRKRTATISV